MDRRTLSPVYLLTACLMLAGCGADGPEPAGTTGVSELPSPAGPDSGEPFLSSSGDGVFLSWLQAAGEGGHDLWLSRLQDHEWSAPLHVAYSDAFFVNWADFPSVSRGSDGRLWAHWLERGGAGGYDYGVRVSISADGGHSWSDPWTPHEDATPTEHGFVSVFPLDGGAGLVWLDGRRYVAAPDGTPPTREMTLRFRTTDGTTHGPEELIDARVCDCCQTDVATTSAGPVVVYRNRTEDEIRDIYVSRRVNGTWTEGRPVHADEWHIGGCPVNGPSVAADGERVVVAWFTAAGGEGRVKIAFSEDAGATFGAPVVVDDGNPVGRVDLMLDGDAALVSWLEQTGAERGEVRVRRLAAGSSPGPALVLGQVASARASGFPRMALTGDGHGLAVWTDPAAADGGRVRTVRFDLPSR